MKSSQLKLLSPLILGLALSAIPALAQKCDDTWDACTAFNICASHTPTCEIKIAHSLLTGNAISKFGGRSADIVCVYAGQDVKWTEDPGEDNSEFAVRFLAAPFENGDYLFQGSSGADDGDWGTVDVSAKGLCFKYSIRQQVGDKVYYADPKVIVNGVGIGHSTAMRRQKPK